MNATDRAHARYEELVAGHALHALEPEEEQDLLHHLQGCAACERDLQWHRETLAQLALADDETGDGTAGGTDAGPALPPALWEAVRREVEATSPHAFDAPTVAGPPAGPGPGSGSARVVDLAGARGRRPLRHRAAAWVSVAAAALVVVAAGGALWGSRDRQGELSDLQAAVRAVATAPARTVPLEDPEGQVQAVAVVQADRLSLVVDGLPQNDASSTTYVLWGRTGEGPVRALAVFDVDRDLDVLRDLPLTPADGAPDLFLVTREQGRQAPAVTAETPLVSGRAA